MGKSRSTETVAVLDAEKSFPIKIFGTESQEELLRIIEKYESINREYLLELMQQRDEIIGVRKENANFLAALNEKIVECKRLTIEYDLIKARLKFFDRVSESFLWRVARRFHRLLTGRKSPEKN